MSIMFLPLQLVPHPARCVVLATVLNMYFMRQQTKQPELVTLLDELANCMLRIHITDANSTLFIGFSNGRVWVHPSSNQEADVCMQADTATFVRLCFAKEDPDALILQGVLQLSGDSAGMLRCKHLLIAADLDWEQELRSAFGEFFGAQVAEAAKKLLSVQQNMQTHFTQQQQQITQKMSSQCLSKLDIPNIKAIEHLENETQELAKILKNLQQRVHKLDNTN
ncbi:MAG: SCP2 sterol-binding domain-containing protein [Mariprofundales bacterium]